MVQDKTVRLEAGITHILLPLVLKCLSLLHSLIVLGMLWEGRSINALLRGLTNSQTLNDLSTT